jgi:hypothetical protein
MNLKNSYLSSIKWQILLMVMIGGTVLNSCKTDKFDIPLNVATIRFSQDSYAIEQNTVGGLNVVIPLSLPLEEDATAILTIDPKSTALSTQYTVTPAIPVTGIKLSLPKGSTQATFNVTSMENFEGNVTVVFDLSTATGGATISNTNASTTVTIKGKPIILPSVTTSVSSLTAFGNVNIGSTSASQSFTVTGVKLTSNVTVAAPANYGVSLDNITFSSSVTISSTAAMAAPVTVYARFQPNAGVNQAEPGSINISSGTLSAVVSVSGTEVGNATPGVLIMKEDFNYGATAGNLTAASGGVWSAYSAGGSLPVQYTGTGLTYSGYAGSGVGGALVSSNNKSSAEDDSWSFPAQGAADGAIYTSQLLNFASAPTSSDFFTSLGDGAAGATPLYYNRIYAKANGSQFTLGVDRNASATIGYTTASYDYGTTYLVVTKYDFTSGTSSIYVLSGTVPSIEPATPDATSSAGAADPTALTRVIIRQSTNLPLSVTYDGIRIATSWKAAVGL